MTNGPGDLVSRFLVFSGGGRPLYFSATVLAALKRERVAKRKESALFHAQLVWLAQKDKGGSTPLTLYEGGGDVYR